MALVNLGMISNIVMFYSDLAPKLSIAKRLIYTLIPQVLLKGLESISGKAFSLGSPDILG